MKKKTQERMRTARPPRTRASSQHAHLANIPIPQDGSSRAPHPSEGSNHIEIRIWLRLLSCTKLIENVLKSKLRSDFGTSLSRFDVLAQLDRFEHGLTMTELSRRLLVSNGAITGLVDKLVAEKLVLREPHATDKRTVIVQLTANGRVQFRRMALRHEEWVISLLGDLSHEARVELLQNLTLLKRRLDGVSGKQDRVDTALQDVESVDEKAD